MQRRRLKFLFAQIKRKKEKVNAWEKYAKLLKNQTKQLAISRFIIAEFGENSRHLQKQAT